jgi:hypothetical protein
MTNNTQVKYHIRNWSEYNKALVQRGSLTIWFSPDIEKKWFAKRERKKGHPKIYSNDLILCALMLKSVYHLPFRALQGFLCSLVTLFRFILPVPCYTEICRRAKELGQKVEKLSRKRPTDLVFDSTGLKLYGEGEWKVKQHGASKRRTWRKIHFAICPESHDIILEVVTGNDEADCEVLPRMKEQIPKSVKRGFGDGAYDKSTCYKTFYALGIEPKIPPQRNARMQNEVRKPWMRARNDVIRQTKGLGGNAEARKLNKKLTGYYRRSLVETAVYRFKTMLGGALSCRSLQNQRAEVYAKCKVINRMNELGMPAGEWLYV